MRKKVINKKISYIPATNNPLSADIGVIKDGKETWLFDVGNGSFNVEGLDDEYNVVLSHFHLDHIGNFGRIKIKNLYVSKETYRHLPKFLIDENKVKIIDKHFKIDNFEIFPIPSSHAKGCIGLKVDNEYAFVGDAIYCKNKDNKLIFNAQLLKEEIDVLKKLDTNYLLVSHLKGFIIKRSEVIEGLELIYQLRKQNNPEIVIDKNELEKSITC